MLSEGSAPVWKSGGIRYGDHRKGFGWVDRKTFSSSRLNK